VEDESFQRMADRNRAVVSWGARERGARQQQPTSAVSQTASNAATAYDWKDWAKSAKLYAQIVQAAPNPRACTGWGFR